MRISHHHSLLPCIQLAGRNLSQPPEPAEKCENGQRIKLKRSYPFQRSVLHTNIVDTNTRIYNITHKVEPPRKNPVRMFIDIYA